MSPGPGFVLDVTAPRPPRCSRRGQRASLERLPEGQPGDLCARAHRASKDPSAAIRDALIHPLGDQEPLPSLLHPDMKLTIAFDDISLPLPPMERPDIRQLVIEQVLDMAAAAGWTT